MTFEEQKQLYQDFQQRFPFESLETMTLEQFTNLDKTSFCYWLEFGTKHLGSIAGGAASKFGIYKFNVEPYGPVTEHDTEYAWRKNLKVSNREEAYAVVKKAVCDIAKAARNNDLDTIEHITIFGDAVKWKIAYMYSEEKLVSIYIKTMLSVIAEELGMNVNKSTTIAEMQRFLIQERASEDSYKFYQRVLDIYFEKAKKEDSKRRYWYCRLGEKSSAWEECYNDSFIALGVEDVGDYSQYKNKDGIIAKLKEVHSDDTSHKQDAKAAWQFLTEIKPGDIVYAISGDTNIIGRAIVTGEYEYNPDRKVLRNIRTVQWTNTGKWTAPQKLPNKTFTEITDKERIKIIESMISQTATTDYSEIIKLLKASHNLILTGAPGTGKTYMASQIAEQLNAECEFVQFHPSYDYTDFVEGLRPTPEGTFERMDGAFKAFCKRALKNKIEASKEDAQREHEQNFEDIMDDFFSDAIENQQEFELKNGNKFVIKEVTEKHVKIESLSNEKTSDIVVRLSEIRYVLENVTNLQSVQDVKNCLKQKWATQQDSYTFKICKEIQKQTKLDRNSMLSPLHADGFSRIAPEKKEKDFIFIIDEINRGELSKIFGELFYSIDPGYRVYDLENNNVKKVKTQYQNLVELDDPFVDGFFIPSNVYIIGTMNDIDRSVESMDFAIRRRFAWKEIVAGEWTGALNQLDSSVRQKAEAKMKAVNDLLSTDGIGLNSAYHIGATYFTKLKDLDNDFDALWNLHLKGLLFEYFRGTRNAQEKLAKIKKAYLEA